MLCKLSNISRQEWQNILSAVFVDFDMTALAHSLRGNACLAIQLNSVTYQIRWNYHVCLLILSAAFLLQVWQNNITATIISWWWCYRLLGRPERGRTTYLHFVVCFLFSVNMKQRKEYDGTESLHLCILCDLFYVIVFCFTNEGKIKNQSWAGRAPTKHYVPVAETVTVSMQ